jgi:VWFA-related protein
VRHASGPRGIRAGNGRGTPRLRALHGLARWTCLASALLAAGARAQVPEFSASTESVEVDVRVTLDGQPLLGLGARDFEVRDNSRSQQVELVSAHDAPLHALLVLDHSSSMAGAKLDQVRSAARALLQALRPDDRASILAFNHRLALPASAVAPAEALRLLDGLRAEGSTALHDALYAALRLGDARAGRPVLLVLSDGAERLSWLSADELREVARESSATLYAVAPVEATRPSKRRKGVFLTHSGVELGTTGRPLEPEALLENLARETGGRTWSATLGQELNAAFLDVLADARRRYVLRYEPDDLTPGWHALDVKVKRRGAKVRARAGYTRAQ